MKIYTKRGDRGETSLIGGTKVLKSSPRIEAYGTVDELNSFMGLTRDNMEDNRMKDVLKGIQDRLFVIGSNLAMDPQKARMDVPDIQEHDIALLEEEMDKMDEQLPEMRNFVLPGGHPANSICHITRCVCRRAERLTVELSQTDHVQPVIITYLNRLSDFLFVLSRKISQDNKAEEIPWRPRN